MWVKSPKYQIFGGIAIGHKIQHITNTTNISQTIPLKNEAKIVKVPNGETLTNHK